MKKVLAERVKIFGDLLPWEHPNFGTDVVWARAYPYEQDVVKGGVFTVKMMFTNHADSPSRAEVKPVLPDGWKWERQFGNTHCRISPSEDGAATVVIAVPEKTESGIYVIPFRITWNNRYLGQFRHALVWIM